MECYADLLSILGTMFHFGMVLVFWNKEEMRED